MNITQSIVRVYADENLTQLVASETTAGPATTIPFEDLTEGAVFWATVQVTADGMQSAESDPFKFYTLPDVEYFTPPGAGLNYISVQMLEVTDTVEVITFGLRLSTDSNFTTYTDYTGPQGGIDIWNLPSNTNFWVRPLIIDEFGRLWVDEDLTVALTTGTALPTINWSGMSAIGTTTFNGAVNVTSTTPILSVVCTYTKQGGTAQTLNLTATTGVQPVNLTGLSPNSQYTVVVRATNAAGYAETTAMTFTTMKGEAAGVEVACGVGGVDNSTNEIPVESKAIIPTDVTITGHYIELWENDTHSGTAFESINCGPLAVVMNTLGHADPDETYFVFSRVTYTIGSDPTEYEAWSDPVEVLTYSLFKFTNVKPTDTTAEVRYAVAGSYAGTEIQYSTDGANWRPIPSGGGDIREGVTIVDLNPDTTYYLRGRCKSAAGWSGWAETTFTTEADSGNEADEVDITSIDYITETTATFTVTIS